MIRLGKTFILIGLLMAIVLGAGPAFANLVTNGDFEAGNSGFTSAYTYHALTTDDPDYAYGTPLGLYEEKYYGVGTSPALYHVSWANFGDHTTTGPGNMMIVNGSTDVGTDVWAENVAVTAGTKYYFSAWLTSVYPLTGQNPIAPATLAFEINGFQIGSDLTLSDPVGTWKLFYQEWTADGSSADIHIINKNTIAAGNDFAIDDIGFKTTNPVPIPAAVWLFGTGLLGLFGVRRKIVK